MVIEHELQTAVEAREEAHLVPVVGQLRALLVSSGQTPLLLDLAQELNFALEFYSIPLDYLENDEMAKVMGPTGIQWTGDSLSPQAVPPLIRQKVAMKDWLASTQVVVGQQKISGEELLKMVANKLGGAHYDTKLPPKLAAMGPFKIGGVTSFYRTLIRLGQVVVHLGRKLMEHSGAQ